jgi:hypothetical protein
MNVISGGFGGGSGSGSGSGSLSEAPSSADEGRRAHAINIALALYRPSAGFALASGGDMPVLRPVTGEELIACARAIELYIKEGKT